jgi:hypothetical protein
MKLVFLVVAAGWLAVLEYLCFGTFIKPETLIHGNVLTHEILMTKFRRRLVASSGGKEHHTSSNLQVDEVAKTAINLQFVDTTSSCNIFERALLLTYVHT